MVSQVVLAEAVVLIMLLVAAVEQALQIKEETVVTETMNRYLLVVVAVVQKMLAKME